MRRVPTELDGERLDRVVALLADASRAQARKLIESGGVTVDGATVEAPALRVTAGSELGIQPIAPALSLQAEEVVFAVVWEDEHLAVIDKPAGIVTHPGAGNQAGTLAGGLIYRWPEIEGIGDDDRWGIVHRLDKGTSGLLVIGKTDTALGGLRQLIKERLIARTYLALVQEPMAIETGTIDAPIERDPSRPMRRRVHPTGRAARTHYQQVAGWPAHALLNVELETGRTHQIRVHLTAIEHPVVGDRTYGATANDPADPGRVWLHSWKLAFDHPITGEGVSCVSPLPEDLVATLEGLGDPESGTVP
ncbi:MAG: RluA family pseudouridine synthase [Acidimicrobiia bacterium]|nr:MAG: RluA family pseudouridine synthase [Acidimicrobiia bacterium]